MQGTGKHLVGSVLIELEQASVPFVPLRAVPYVLVSIHFQYPLTPQGHGGLLEPIPDVTERSQGETLDKSPVHHIHPIHLTYMFLECGRKLENQDRTNADNCS